MPYAKSQRVSEAYATLDLEEGVSLDAVKSAYRKASHKNPDNPNATQLFQRISEAYTVLLRHFSDGDSDEDSDYGYEYDYGYEGYEDDDYEDEYADELYRRLFELFMREEEHAFYARAHQHRPRKEEESPEQYQAQIQKFLDDQKAGEERRQKERMELKEKRQKERERERCEAEERQRLKSSNKKATAKTQRQKDMETIRQQQKLSQRTRSAVFAAARKGDSKRVERGIWEEHVDAAGGEVKDGCDDFVETAPSDPQETLLHIASMCGDHALVKWLDGHGAELEEKNSSGLTAFHVALQHGHISIVSYFFEEHPPSEDAANIYEPPAVLSLLSLAVESMEPELVWMIIDKKLASKEDTEFVHKKFLLCKDSLLKNVPTKRAKITDIEQLLARYDRSATTHIRTGETNVPKETSYHRPSKPVNSKQTEAKVPRANGTHAFEYDHHRGRGRGRGRAFVAPSPAVR